MSNIDDRTPRDANAAFVALGGELKLQCAVCHSEQLFISMSRPANTGTFIGGGGGGGNWVGNPGLVAGSLPMSGPIGGSQAMYGGSGISQGVPNVPTPADTLLGVIVTIHCGECGSSYVL